VLDYNKTSLYNGKKHGINATRKVVILMRIANLLTFLTDPYILTHDNAPAAAAAQDAGAETMQQAATGGGLFGGDWTTLIIMYGALFAFGYFFMYRPHKKRQAETRDMLSAIKVGDSIITTSGLFGKIVDIPSQDVYVVEFGLNKGIRIPISKTAVSGVAEPNMTEPKT